MAYMMVYAYEDLDHQLHETKFGDHFVSEDLSYDEAVQHTMSYMRTQFPRRGKHFDSDRVLKQVWDVSDFAKSKNKFKPHSHIDDVIRPNIGYKGTQGQEFHSLRIADVINKVSKFLNDVDQPKIDAGLSTLQYKTAETVLDYYHQGDRTILAELCARFGKTIWSGAVGVETGRELTIVVSYVQTVFTSFENDLLQFNQFSDHVHVNTKDKDYKDQIQAAFDADKKVIAYLSMCKDSKNNRQSRIDFLFSYNAGRYVIIDEGDFGVHTKGQAEPLLDARSDDDFIIIMTGTNSDKAASSWNIDNMVSVTYPELLMQKEESIAQAV